jgi:hypothetical protein
MTKRTETKKVQLTRPGAVAVGPYKAGEICKVPADEAARLVKVKGFKYAENETETEPKED